MARFRFSAALSVLLIGCRDSAGPGNVAGPYVLTAVDSLGVPRVVSATHSCDELVLRGSLYLGDNALFDLSVTQAQDCTRTGGSVDTFTTTTSGGFTVDGTRLVLHPSGTGIQLTGTTSSATVDLQLPLQAFSVAGLELPQQQPLGRQYGNHE